MRTISTAAVAATVLLAVAGSSSAASVSKSYSYFSIGGSTLSEIEAELSRRGPHVESSGERHPGATIIQFTTKLGFRQEGASCRIAKAAVNVRAKVKLPTWRRPKKASEATRIIWATLSSDIKRHEESHIGIAKNAARSLEQALGKLGAFRSCKQASDAAHDVSARILAQHDNDQAQFDRIEGKNFESRILSLLHYRLEQMKAQNPPG